MKYWRIKSLFIVLAIALLSACGGGGGGSSAAASDETLTGVFIDSAVQGLTWVSGNLTGTTDVDGTFQYTAGSTVSFYVGGVNGILVGTASGGSVIIPLDFVPSAQDNTNSTVTNIVSFLMTLDDNNDPSDGIVITSTVANLALGETIDFTLPTADFAASGANQILVSTMTAATTAGAHALTSAADAQAHASISLQGLLAGSYTGTYSGTASGAWIGSLTTAGVLSGTAGGLTFQGTVSTNGSGTTEFTSGNVSDGTTFTGRFYPDGTASGTWSHTDGSAGTWSGTKTVISTTQTPTPTPTGSSGGTSSNRVALSSGITYQESIAGYSTTGTDNYIHYTFTPGSNSAYQISLTNVSPSGVNMDWNLYDSNTSNVTRCSNDTNVNGDEVCTTITLVANTAYTLQVINRDIEPASYSLLINLI